MNYRVWIPITGVLALAVSARAEAATPTYWDDRVAFEASLTQSVLDDYSSYVVFQQYTDEAMSAVLGETDYEATGYLDQNYITNDGFGNQYYCASCGGSYQLSFTTTSVDSGGAVQAVGLEIIDIDQFFEPYFAYITFADGTDDDIALPGPGTFWGVSAPEGIVSIHFGQSGGGATMSGWVYIDDLLIGRQLCGNGMLDPDEECDDAGETEDCDANCTFVSCGDGDWNATAGEACDDAGDSADCDFDCTLRECGDLYVNPVVELCDDGSGETKICDADCTAAECGDGTFNATAGEQCDDAGDSATCNADCTLAACGDGILNEVAGEVCDDAGESASCDIDCTPVECGDGVINETAGEICDDAKGSAECDLDCTVPECGDGLANMLAGEDCDGDGKGTPGETVVCDLDCTVAECGDGVINETRGEQCDDGNLSDADGCSSLCILDDPVASTGDESSTGEDPDTTSGTTSATTTVDMSTDTDTDTDGAGATSASGCACSSQPSRGGGVWALFVLLLAARRRRA